MLARAVATALLAGLFLAGCPKRPPAPAPVAAARLADDALLRELASRATLDPARARFQIKMDSPKLRIVAPPLPGGLILDHPEQAFLSIQNPVGGPVLTVARDGARVVLLNMIDRLAVVSDDASALLAPTGLHLDDAVGLLLGRLPLDPADVTARADVDGLVRFSATVSAPAADPATPPRSVALTLDVDAASATPRALTARGPDGAVALEATWAPFQLVDGALLPTTLSVWVPSVELRVEVTFKTWDRPDPVPDVFHPAPPGSFEVLDFAAYGLRMRDRMGPAAAPPTTPPAAP
jgi:hypothetical protein